MHEISPFDSIEQRLQDLTLKQLLEIKVKIDTLIEEKIVSVNGNQAIISHFCEISPVFAAIDSRNKLWVTQNPNRDAIYRVSTFFSGDV